MGQACDTKESHFSFEPEKSSTSHPNLVLEKSCSVDAIRESSCFARCAWEEEKLSARGNSRVFLKKCLASLSHFWDAVRKKQRQITRNLKAPTPYTIKVARNSAYPTFSKLFSFSIICWRSFSEAKAAWYPATLNTVHGVSRFLGNLIINAKRVTGGLESRKALSINAPTWTSYLSEFRNNFFFDFKAQLKEIR